MTKISLGQGDGRYFLEFRGHAAGSERVCAGVSAIVYALAGWLVNAEDAGLVRVHRLELHSGEAELMFSGGAEVETAFQVAEIGLRQLAESFPAFLSVSAPPP